MAKSSYDQIKIDEGKIIEELGKNARGSIDDIAKKCGFSRQKVWRLINKLEKNKYIWGYSVIADHEKIGLKDYLILIKKTTTKLDKLPELIISRDIEKKAKKLDIKIATSSYLHGAYDWLICISAKDIIHAKRFNEQLIDTYKEFIKETILLENIFQVKKCGIINPQIHKLKEFV
jgi:DNA-binding Lrp family transcriptional regulator